MTDTAPITDTAGGGTSQPAGTLEHLDPHSLTVEPSSATAVNGAASSNK